MNPELLRTIIRAFVAFSAADPDPLTDTELNIETQRILDVSLIETTPLDATTDPFPLPALAYMINFYDDCDVRIIAFVNDDETFMCAMISADHQSYVPMTYFPPVPRNV